MAQIPFAQVVEKYADSIFAVAYNRCKSRADADDVVQNVLLRYYGAQDKLQSEEHIRNWLLRVAVNESKRLCMTPWRRREAPLEEHAELAAPAAEDTGLREAVMALPAHYRTVVHLYYFEDYPIREISKMLRLPSSTVQTRLQRARAQLKKTLREAWEDDE